MTASSPSSNLPMMPAAHTVLEKHGFTAIMRWPDKNTIQHEEALDSYFLKGLVPPAPIIRKDHQITAFGSCFAGHVSRYLHGRKYKVNAHQWDHNQSDLIRIDEIMVHTPALRAQFEWAFSGKELGQIFIGGAEEKAKTYHGFEDTKALITSSDIYIITLGLTEAWFDLEQQQYLWKFIPHRRIDPKRFVSKSVSYQENLDNIETIYSLIKSKRPDSQIIFTLSPIPLLGTYSGKGTVPANSFSKATLRAAIGEFMQRHAQDATLFYFPSYEIVTQYIPDPWETDNRHITEASVQQIMRIFHRHFLIE